MMQRFQLLHGGDYNPEQWLDRPDILAQDIALMKKAPVNTVTLGCSRGRRWSRRKVCLRWTGWPTSSTACMTTAFPPFWPPPVRRAPVDGATLPETQAFVLCEVAALQDTDPTTLLSVYTEDYFAGCPAVAIHSYGAGRAYYLASRFDAAFYRAFYRNAAQETGLTPAWPEALPDGVLAARRGAFVFVQNCNEHPVEVGGVALNRYGTAVWKNGEQIL